MSGSCLISPLCIRMAVSGVDVVSETCFIFTWMCFLCALQSASLLVRHVNRSTFWKRFKACHVVEVNYSVRRVTLLLCAFRAVNVTFISAVQGCAFYAEELLYKSALLIFNGCIVTCEHVTTSAFWGPRRHLLIGSCTRCNELPKKKTERITLVVRRFEPRRCFPK